MSPGSRAAGSALATALIALLLAATAQAQDSILYATDAGRQGGAAFGIPSNLYTVDPVTGEATLIGPVRERLTGPVPYRNYFAVNGITFLSSGPPDGQGDVGSSVLAVGSFFFRPQNPNIPTLLRLDLATGEVERIGNLDFVTRAPNNPRCNVFDLGNYTAAQTLVATGDCDGVASFMIVTDQVIADPAIPPVIPFPPPPPLIARVYRTIIGPTGFSGGGRGLAFEPGSLENFFSTSGADFIGISPFTGAGSAIGTGTILGSVTSLDFDPMTGELIGAQTGLGRSFLATIDPSTGELTQGPEILVDGAPPPFTVAAIAFSPEGGCAASPLGAPVKIPDPFTGDRVVSGLTSCREPINSGGAQLTISSSGSLSFSGTIGVAVDASVYADPTTDRDWSICVYDSQDYGASLVMGGRAPAGSGWAPANGGFRFRSSDAADAVRRMTLGVAREGQSFGSLSAAGRGMTPPTLPLVQGPSVYAQIVSDQGDCFGATFSSSIVNSSSRFQAVSD